MNANQQDNPQPATHDKPRGRLLDMLKAIRSSVGDGRGPDFLRDLAALYAEHNT